MRIAIVAHDLDARHLSEVGGRGTQVARPQALRGLQASSNFGTKKKDRREKAKKPIINIHPPLCSYLVGSLPQLVLLKLSWMVAISRSKRMYVLPAGRMGVGGFCCHRLLVEVPFCARFGPATLTPRGCSCIRWILSVENWEEVIAIVHIFAPFILML